MNHQPRKRFGQNFLNDAHVVQSIISAFQPKIGQHIVEIGPGLGVLTTKLLPIIKRLQVVELDRDLISKLKENCAAYCENPDDLTVYNEDVLKFDFGKLSNGDQPLRIIGNLPYNISTPLIFYLLDQTVKIQDMYFMLQKEVVDRMVASPGGRQFGRLSVMVQYYCKVNKLFDVDASAFIPSPKVQSAIVQLIPHNVLPVKATDEKQLKQITTQAFSQRRKTLRNCLKEHIDVEQLVELGIDPGTRAEQLSVNQFVAISNKITKMN
ncbi:MAG: 16S rRNA (adenine(1518)-N(6)/adenine(1519)-N(6))-dimethyltransferase RsmA [Gammaproteobacteria bacterium]|nr:16S rRNA (adenine(1518)-N(6)/adenine(1519)-N(6))-dimethyltransferase RsmA [Gammaproteobacteria bacterium]